jgi:hypothetical protein
LGGEPNALKGDGSGYLREFQYGSPGIDILLPHIVKGEGLATSNFVRVIET